MERVPSWFTEVCDSSLGSYQFDIFQRYTFLRHLLSLTIPHDINATSVITVLDVGSGPSRLSEEFLGPRYKITRADVAACADPEVVRLEPEGPLPFRDREFQVVLALDVLEHVPAAQRARLVRECARVAQTTVVISCPDGSADVCAAEQRVSDAYSHMFHQQNPFLAEHSHYGTPEMNGVVQILKEIGSPYLVINNVPLQLWEAYTLMDFVLISSAELFDLKDTFTRKLNARGPAWFANGPHYRRFYVTFDREQVKEEVAQALGLSSISETCEFHLGPAWELSRLLAETMLSEGLLARQKTQLAQLLSAKEMHISALEGVIRQNQTS